MKKLIFTLTIILFSSFFCVTNGCNKEDPIINNYTISVEKPIKVVTLYIWNGQIVNGQPVYKAFKRAGLYKDNNGVYFIQLENTSIRLNVYRENHNGFNSWSVDSWGTYYYYNI